jgi:hypothetical protein
MKDESKHVGLSTAGGTDTPALPAVVDRATFQAELDALRVREKAHTREGTPSAARRRLPMVDVRCTPLIGALRGTYWVFEDARCHRILVATGHPAGSSEGEFYHRRSASCPSRIPGVTLPVLPSRATKRPAPHFMAGDAVQWPGSLDTPWLDAGWARCTSSATCDIDPAPRDVLDDEARRRAMGASPARLEGHGRRETWRTRRPAGPTVVRSLTVLRTSSPSGLAEGRYSDDLGTAGAEPPPIASTFRQTR